MVEMMEKGPLNILAKLNLILLTLLSVASGAAKVMRMPQEVAFFGNAGMDETGVVVFGVTQLLGGALLALRKTRLAGALVMAATFAISTVVILMAGDLAFALFSLLPIVLLGVVFFAERRGPGKTAQG